MGTKSFKKGKLAWSVVDVEKAKLSWQRFFDLFTLFLTFIMNGANLLKNVLYMHIQDLPYHTCKCNIGVIRVCNENQTKFYLTFLLPPLKTHECLFQNLKHNTTVINPKDYFHQGIICVLTCNLDIIRCDNWQFQTVYKLKTTSVFFLSNKPRLFVSAFK